MCGSAGHGHNLSVDCSLFRGNGYLEIQYQKEYSLTKHKVMTILTRHKWLELAKVSGWSGRSCSELGPAWAEAKVMPQTVRVSALSAHSSQWSWLGIGEQQSSCTGHVLICHTEWGSDVDVSKPDMGSD